MKTITDVITFPLNSTLERYLLDEEFLDLLNKADIPITVIGDRASVSLILFPKLQLFYKHFHGRNL